MMTIDSILRLTKSYLIIYKMYRLKFHPSLFTSYLFYLFLTLFSYLQARHCCIIYVYFAYLLFCKLRFVSWASFTLYKSTCVNKICSQFLFFCCFHSNLLLVLLSLSITRFDYIIALVRYKNEYKNQEKNLYLVARVSISLIQFSEHISNSLFCFFFCNRVKQHPSQPLRCMFATSVIAIFIRSIDTVYVVLRSP